MTVLCDRCVARQQSGHIKAGREKAARWTLWPPHVAPAHLCTTHLRQLDNAFPTVARLFYHAKNGQRWREYRDARRAA